MEKEGADLASNMEARAYKTRQIQFVDGSLCATLLAHAINPTIISTKAVGSNFDVSDSCSGYRDQRP